MSQYRSMSLMEDVYGTDERTSFVRTAKAQRKYGSTNINMSEPSLKYQPSSFTQHRVQPGDTLQGIALRYKTSVNTQFFPFFSCFDFSNLVSDFRWNTSNASTRCGPTTLFF